MKMNLNNGGWGYDFYFDDPNFPQQLHAWLHTVDSSDLVISNLVTWLAEHNVMGNAYVISEEPVFYSGAERIVNQVKSSLMTKVTSFRYPVGFRSWKAPS